MITDVTKYIADWILAWPKLTGDCLLTEDPEITYKDGLHLAYKDPIKGVLIKTSEEFEYSGIDDRRGNFFYIRHVDDEELTYNPVENRVASCLKDTQITANLRLVSIIQDVIQVHGKERYGIEEFLRNALLNLDFTAYTGVERNIEIELTLSRVNSPQVLAEERVDDTTKRGFDLRNIFTAIDFILKFTFNHEIKRAGDPVVYEDETEENNPLNLVSSCPCEFWYDGQDADTFTLNGVNVIRWDDKSGNARHLLNAVDAQRPSYDVATGRVSFVVANNDYLQSAAFGPLAQPNTIFILYKITGALNLLEIVFDGATLPNGIFYEAGLFKIYAGLAFISSGMATDVNDNIHMAEFNGATSNYWINGTLKVTDNPGADALDGITLGNIAALNEPADVEIMEVFGYNCIITAEERVALENYLTTKWSL